MAYMNMMNQRKMVCMLLKTDLQQYDHRKKQETKDIALTVALAWQFMEHSMICMSGQPGKLFVVR